MSHPFFLRNRCGPERPTGLLSVLGGIVSLLVVGVACAGMLLPNPAVAQEERALNLDSLATTRALPIEQVRADINENSVPDRVGDTVIVQGRALVRPGGLPDSALIFLQDATAGLAVQLSSEANVRRGDSLLVQGVVEYKYGLTRLRGLEYFRVDAMTDLPEPVPLTVTAADGDAYEGRLVRVRGRVIVNRTNEGGRYLLLEEEVQNADARLAVFVPRRRVDEVSLEGFESGELVTVTGILGQHDVSVPYDDGYQVLPRDQADLERVGFVAEYYPTIIIFFIAAGLLAVIAVFTLRAAVRRRTEQLAESRARFRRLSEATFEGILLHEDGEIVDVNRALTDMSGYERQELLGRNVRTVLSDSSPDRIDGATDRPRSPYEAVVVRKDGSSFPAEVEEKEIDVADRNARVVALRNITDRKKRETELLLAKEEAEQMARLKSSLLNNMSHELRTPVTSIIGYAELIQEEPETDHTEFAARIQQSGKRLSRTLQSVLDMARLESGAIQVKEGEVRIGPFLREVVEEHRALAVEKGVSIHVETTEVPSLHTDRSLLRRSVSNLVHNAVKFTDRGRVDVTATPAPSGVRIAVTDTGVGIDPEFRADLFEPFKQESKGRTRTHEGTGLGLALTKRMVEVLGGTVEVESTKGEGSTFTIELPPRVAAGDSLVPGGELESA